MARFDAGEQKQFQERLNPRRADLLERIDARRLPYGVAIDNPEKEMNIGNLMRTAHSYLCGEIVLIGSNRFHGAGSHGVEHFERIRHLPTREEFLAWLPASGYTPIAVEVHPDGERLDRFTFPERPLFILGSEREGLDEALIRAAARKLTIPQFGMVPCLNVNISCSIVLYQYVTMTYPDLEMTPIRGRKFLVDEGSGRPYQPRAEKSGAPGERRDAP